MEALRERALLAAQRGVPALFLVELPRATAGRGPG